MDRPKGQKNITTENCIIATNIFSQKTIYFDFMSECKSYFHTSSQAINRMIKDGSADKKGWVFDVVDLECNEGVGDK